MSRKCRGKLCATVGAFFACRFANRRRAMVSPGQTAGAERALQGPVHALTLSQEQMMTRTGSQAGHRKNFAVGAASYALLGCMAAIRAGGRRSDRFTRPPVGEFQKPAAATGTLYALPDDIGRQTEAYATTRLTESFFPGWLENFQVIGVDAQPFIAALSNQRTVG